ncbi:MAG: SOS response-associated peptidase family protein [Chloroflexia bacterium]
MFRGLVSRARCVVPASGWYEWTAVPGSKAKQPWFITDPEGKDLLGLAGLIDRWEEADGTPRAACAIVTTAAATDDLRALHERMPVGAAAHGGGDLARSGADGAGRGAAAAGAPGRGEAAALAGVDGGESEWAE